VNTEKYIDILRRLRDAVRRKHPGKWRTNSWILLHENAPAHRSVLVKDFSVKINVTILKHSPHSPEMAPADFYFFPRLKSTLKGQRFCDGTDIKNEMEELKRLSPYGFQECFQHPTAAGRSL
jgi:hypothetical protein